MSRRVVVRGAGLAGAGALLGCSDRPPAAPAVPDAAPARPEPGPVATGGRPGNVADTAAPASSDAAPPRADVTVEAAPEAVAPALSDDQLLAAIDHIVVLCMENRSFDHALGARSLLEGRPVDGLRREMKNLARDGREIFVGPLASFATADPPHDWDPVHRQWNEGAMDGFAREVEAASAGVVMGYYGREQLPVSWALADHFVTCDRWFSSLLGPTWPNRFYLHGATANGVRDNLPTLGFTSIFNRLTEAGVSHANYFVDVPWSAGGYFKSAGNQPVERFFAAAASGELPAFSIIDPGFFGAAANDDHPAHDVRLGQAFISTVYNALRYGPLWKRCLFVVIYDEHGGFFDHVSPPTMPSDERPEFRQLGMRVPALVAGGPVRRGETVSTTFDHVSVLATATRRFGLRPLNDRARATRDLAACIDPALVGAPRPGPELPLAPPVPLARLRELDAKTRGRRPAQHAELWDMCEAGRIPAALDRRAQALALTERWLRTGADLGALRLR